MILVWTQFLILGAVIAVAGYWLSRFGDIIAERTGLSGSWIGLILMATVTSLPELVTGVSAVTVAHAPDLAVADALGSCLFNLLLLSVMDFFYRPACMFQQASQGHVLSAGYGAILLGIVGLNILIPPRWPGAPIGVATVLIVATYLLALRTIFTFERRQLLEPAEPAAARYPDISLRRAIIGYAVAAACVVAAGLRLPNAALDLAQAMGWTSTFVGTLFLAGATSMPELVVTITAVRIGALDMAVANLLGSNLFNMLVLAVDDVAYPAGPLLSGLSSTHLVTVFTALVMNGVVTAGLIYRPAGRAAGTVSWVSLGLIAAYAANVWLLISGEMSHG